MSASSSSPPDRGSDQAPAASGNTSPPCAQTTSRCSHFGTCGGCASQNLPYEEQLRRKAERVSASLGQAVDVRPSPDIWFYRNKMEFSFGDVYPPVEGASNLLLGLKPKRRWYEVLDLKECFLLSPETGALLAAVRAWAAENGVPPYNSHKHTGVLRHLVVREAKNNQERMILLVTAPGELPKDPFLEAVRSCYPATTVLRGVNSKASDTAHCESIEVWQGPGFITETLRFSDPNRDLRLRVSPQSFFQTNTRGAEALYGKVRSWLGRIKPALTLDLYCGGGGIALSVADACARVLGVEQNPAAVADAKNNAALNAIENALFHPGSVEAVLPSLLAEKKPDAVIVDPPRAGLHPKTLDCLFELGCPNLIYVSCNPEALKRDLAVLKGLYRVEEALAFDLFPHTEHVETAVWLRRD